MESDKSEEDSSFSLSEYSRVFESYEIPTTSIPESAPIPTYSMETPVLFDEPLIPSVADEHEVAVKGGVLEEVAKSEEELIEVSPIQELPDIVIPEMIIEEENNFVVQGEAKKSGIEAADPLSQYDFLPEYDPPSFNELSLVKEQVFLPGTEEKVDEYIEKLPPLPSHFLDSRLKMNEQKTLLKMNEQKTSTPAAKNLITIIAVMIIAVSLLISFVG